MWSLSFFVSVWRLCKLSTCFSDWLDSGNHKKALQECDKVLKKTPNLQCAKALKSLALLRLGKESESVALLNSLVDEKPCDDGTLQAMTLCYRELQQRK